jgi:hypothetical protein
MPVEGFDPQILRWRRGESNHTVNDIGQAACHLCKDVVNPDTGILLPTLGVGCKCEKPFYLHATCQAAFIAAERARGERAIRCHGCNEPLMPLRPPPPKRRPFMTRDKLGFLLFAAIVLCAMTLSHVGAHQSKDAEDTAWWMTLAGFLGTVLTAFCAGYTAGGMAMTSK